MSKQTTPAQQEAVRRLGAVAAFGLIGLSLSFTYATTGLGLPCLWRQLTHTLCPFCGATTMGAALVRGDLAAAWAANQLVLIALIGLALVSLNWLIAALGGRHLRPRGWIRKQTHLYVIASFVALGYALVRNLAGLG